MIGRPETHPVKKIIGFSETMIAAIEVWRSKQRPAPNLSEAIRHLVQIGLQRTTARKSSDIQKTRAKELAGGAIDRLTDSTASADDKATRKRRLIKGPEEFRDTRVDRTSKK